MSDIPWIDRLQEDAELLLQAVEGWKPGEPPYPRGADGLQQLRLELKRQVALEDCTEEEDRLWVERAGAWLGLLLLDSLGGDGAARREDTSF